MGRDYRPLSAKEIEDRDYLYSISSNFKHYGLAGTDLETVDNGLLRRHSLLLQNYQLDLVRTPLWRPGNWFRKGRWIMSDGVFDRYEIRLTENGRSVRVRHPIDSLRGLDTGTVAGAGMRYEMVVDVVARSCDNGFYTADDRPLSVGIVAEPQNEHLYWGAYSLFHTMEREVARRADADNAAKVNVVEPVADFRIGGVAPDALRVRVLHGMIERLKQNVK